MKCFKTGIVYAMLLLLTGTYVQAEENPNTAIQYSVNKIPSDKEPDPSNSYFDLVVKPGETIELQAKIYNAQSEDIEVQQAAYTSFTNQNGEISYATKIDEKKLDESLKVKFSSIAQVGKTVIVPANNEQIVPLVIHVPKNAQNGVILGSWYFEQTDQNKDQKDNGISIKNKYSYAIGVKMTVNQEIPSPNLHLKSVKPSLNNYQKVINANIQNDQPAILSKLTIHASVTKKGSKKVLYENDKGTVTMAPNSNFDYPLFLGAEQLKAGEYTLHLKAKTADPKWPPKTWEWDKVFTISSEKAKKLNNQAINDEKPPISIWWYVAGGSSLLLVVIVLSFLVASRRYKRKLQLLINSEQIQQPKQDHTTEK